MRIVTLTTTVTPDHTLTIRVPQDVPTGQAEVVVVFDVEPRSRRTLGDLRSSEFFGMWRDRTDLPDSPVLARALRRQAWERSLQ